MVTAPRGSRAAILAPVHGSQVGPETAAEQPPKTWISQLQGAGGPVPPLTVGALFRRSAAPADSFGRDPGKTLEVTRARQCVRFGSDTSWPILLPCNSEVVQKQDWRPSFHHRGQLCACRVTGS